MERNREPVWKPARGGIAWKPVPNASPPVAASAARLVQLRQMSRDFAVDKTDREGIQRELRLLPQPIYRYSSSDWDVLDGAVFVFVQGTDPELLLLIEAVQHEESSRWQYALARMNSVRFVVSRRGEIVWEVDILPWSQVQNRNEPYSTFRVD